MKTTKHILTLVFIGLFSLVLTACSEEKKEQAEDSLSDFKNAASQAMDDAKDAASDASALTQPVHRSSRVEKSPSRRAPE